MIAIPDIQPFRYSKPASNGRLYVGAAGANPLTTPLSVYFDYAGTDSQPTPIALDFNGLPVHPITGQVYPTVYVDYNYSVQIVDADNVELFNPFISSDV